MHKCIYCGRKKIQYDIWGVFSSCPTYGVPPLITQCMYSKKFIVNKEIKIQKALGLYKLRDKF